MSKNTNHLAHHGIKGQKWGVRRWQYEDGSLTPEGYIHYYGHGKKEAQGVVKKVTRAISGKTDSDDYADERKNAPVDPKTGLGLKTKYMSDVEDLKRINPDFGKPGYSKNCYKCTVTYDLRRRGYDVAAGEAYSGYLISETKRFYKNPVIMADKSMEDAESQILSQGNGARGNICAYFKAGGGHSVAYEVNNNKVYILDGQNNQKYTYSEFFGWIDGKQHADKYDTSYFDNVSYCRLDDREPNIEQMKKEGIIKYGKR